MLPAASTKELEKREFVVDSGASMVSKKDLNSVELETMRTSRSPTTVMTTTTRCKPEKKRRCTSSSWTSSSKLSFLKKLPAVLSLWKLCDDHGYTYHWISGQKPHVIRNGKRIDCKFSNKVPFAVLGLSASSSSTTPSPTSPPSSSQDSIFVVNRCTEKSSTRKKWKYE